MDYSKSLFPPPSTVGYIKSFAQIKVSCWISALNFRPSLPLRCSGNIRHSGNLINYPLSLRNIGKLSPANKATTSPVRIENRPVPRRRSMVVKKIRLPAIALQRLKMILINRPICHQSSRTGQPQRIDRDRG